MKSCGTEYIENSVPCLWQHAMSLLNNQRDLPPSTAESACCEQPDTSGQAGLLTEQTPEDA